MMKSIKVNIMQKLKSFRKKGGIRRDISIKFASELINIICGILTFSVFASLLTKSEYAVSNQLIALVVLVVPVILLRINTAYCVFLPGESDLIKLKSRFVSSLLISLFICLISVGIIVLNKSTFSYILFGTSEYSLIVSIVAAYFVLLSVSTLVQDFYRATGKINKSSMLITLNAILRALLFLSFTKMERSLTLQGVLLTYGFTELIILIIGLFNIYNDYRDIPIKLEFSKLKEYYQYSLPLVPYSIFGWINASVGKLMINHLMDLESSGIYTFNYSLVLRIFVLNTVVGYTIFPYISKAWNNRNKEQVSVYISKAFNIGVFLGFPITFGILAVLPSVANILSKGNYEADKLIVGILCIAMIFNMLYTVFSYLIDLSRKTIWYTIILFITATFNIISNFILIPRYGLYGAATVFLLTNLIQAILVIFIGTKITTIRIKISIKYIIKSLIISMLMYGITSVLYQNSSMINFIMSVLVGIITYFGIHYIVSKITNESLI